MGLKGLDTPFSPQRLSLAARRRNQPQVSSWRGVGMGVSKDYDGLGQLKAVPGELAAVIHSDATAGSRGRFPEPFC
jgi:hypothetical protein